MPAQSSKSRIRAMLQRACRHWNSKYPIQRDLPESASLNFADGQLLLPFEELATQ
jgi:hypothetical protein